MKLLAKALAFLALLIAAPALAERVAVVGGDSNALNGSGLWTHGMDTAHSDFYVVQGTGWGVDQLQANTASINSHGTVQDFIVAIGTNDAGSGAYADAAAWIADLYSLFATVRADNPGVKIYMFTLNPITGDATHTSRRPTINATLRADEGNGTGPDYIIDIAANPTMSAAGATSDTNLYINEAAIVHYAYCTGACTVTAPVSPSLRAGDLCYGTLGSAKGHNYIMKQVECALQSGRAGHHPWTVYAMPLTYSTSPVHPSVDPPVYALAQPASVASTVTVASWLKQDNIQAPTVPPSSEHKFRTVMEGNGFAARFDYGRSPNVEPYGDCLEYWGNLVADKNMNYTRARNTQSTAGASNAAGGPLNPTVYANSCLWQDNALGDGVRRVRKSNDHITYYTNWMNLADGLTIWQSPRGMQYSFGVPPHDPENSIQKSELTAAVSWQSYSDSFTGWFCDDGNGESQKFLVNADGTPAFTTSSGPSGMCPTSAEIYAQSFGPGCMDGVNLRSASNFDHVRLPVGNNSSGREVCPDNWYPIAETENKSFYSHQGAADIATLQMDQDATATANSTNGTVYRHGEAYYRTWLGAWEPTTILSWSSFCIAAKLTTTDSYTGHECNVSTISAIDRLLGGSGSENAPDGSRTPQVNGGHTFAGDQAGDWLSYPAAAGGGGVASRARGRLKLRAEF